MIRSRRLKTAYLIRLCRVIRPQLEAGISLLTILEQQAKRGPRPLRQVIARLHQKVASGQRFAEAVASEPLLPPLFASLVAVGEKTGYLVETLHSLEQYYRLLEQLERRFRARIAGPIAHFVIAVGLITLVIWILGLIATPGRPAITVFGLSGASGALIFLGAVVTAFVGIWISYQVLAFALHNREWVSRLLLRVPVLGKCLRAIALSRFCLALHLTLETELPWDEALELSFKATGNRWYESLAKSVAERVNAGEPLSTALAATGAFPVSFLKILETAELAGRVPEVMRRQSIEFYDESTRCLRALTELMAWGVWLIYATFAVVMIIQFARVYLDALSGAL